MKSLTLIILMVITAHFSFAQKELTGWWYAIINDTTYGYEFTPATFGLAFFSKQLDQTSEKNVGAIRKVVMEHGNVYFLVSRQSQEVPVTVWCFSQIKPDSVIVQYTAGKSGQSFGSIEEAMVFVQSDTVSNSRIYFYSQNEFLRVMDLPTAQNINKADYKRFLKELVKETKVDMITLKRRKALSEDDILTCLVNHIEGILVSLNYRPPASGEEVEQILGKYSDDKEVQTLQHQLEQVMQ